MNLLQISAEIIMTITKLSMNLLYISRDTIMANNEKL